MGAPSLPLELIIDIISRACAHKQSLLSLSLVSSWTHELTAPHLFHTVVFTTVRQIQAFLEILPFHPPEWWATHLRNLWIAYPDPGRLCAPIFKLGTTNIALRSNLLHLRNDPNYFLSQLLEQCSELTLIGTTFPLDFEDTRSFDNVAYLRFTEPLLGPRYTGGQIAKMKSLTHITIPFQEPEECAEVMLEQVDSILRSPSLVMVVLQKNTKNRARTSSEVPILYRSIDEWRLIAWRRDLRLHVIEEDGRGFGKVEWGEAARGCESIWERAAMERKEWLQRGTINQELSIS